MSFFESLVRHNRVFIHPFWWILGSIVMVLVFRWGVDLSPQVEKNFFFSSKDPGIAQEEEINRLFPQPTQIVLNIRGKIRTPEYFREIKEMSSKLSALPGVYNVQSLSNGPGSYQNALESPLWKRVLIAENQDSTFIHVYLDSDRSQTAVRDVEAFIKSAEKDRTGISISGVPYIDEIIRRKLLIDMKTFTMLCVSAFGIVIFCLFREPVIILGMGISCVIANILTLTAGKVFGVSTGPLTANIATIVTVLTLAHMIYMTFNRKIADGDESEKQFHVIECVRKTIRPSAWSMGTTLLGFLSLLLTTAEPLKQLGMSGALGTVFSFMSAFLIYPSFLETVSKPRITMHLPFRIRFTGKSIMGKPHRLTASGLALIFMLISAGIIFLKTDPSLMDYFRKGGQIRPDLEMIDRDLGSTPLKLVIVDSDGKKFNSAEDLSRLWDLHNHFENSMGVKTVISLPLLMEEAKNNLIGSILPAKWLLKIMESPSFGSVTDYFIDESRKKTLFILMMAEDGRSEPRSEAVRQAYLTAEKHGFKVELAGGAYLLMSKMSGQVMKSLYAGLIMLIGVFGIAIWCLTGQLHMCLATAICLSLIPVTLLGLEGLCFFPIDIISAPGPSLAVSIGVDAMIHMLMHVKNNKAGGLSETDKWRQSILHLWKPVFSSVAVIGIGFSIFMWSQFPPTQRFGFNVAAGSVIAGLTALFILPVLAVLIREKLCRLKGETE